MNFEGNATLYTGFALIAIESAWPNPSGNELSQNDYDLTLLQHTEQQPHKSTPRSQFRPGREALSSVSSADDYEKVQGYYRILPLNVIGARTSTGGDGSSFNVTFTLDDLILITNDIKPLLDATGLPVNVETMVESELRKALPILQSFKDSDGVEWKYVNDEELGLSRYKISGASSSFNVEDLVRPNDTVTIWMYHDPQDFYNKDSDALIDVDEELRLSTNIKNVVGSGSRMNQFSTDKPTFTGGLFTSLGLVNPYVSDTIQGIIKGTSDGDAGSQVQRVNKDNIGEVLNNFVTLGAGTVFYSQAESQLADYTAAALSSEDAPSEKGVTANVARNIFDHLIRPYYNGGFEILHKQRDTLAFDATPGSADTTDALAITFNETGSTSGGATIHESGSASERVRAGRMALRSMMSSLDVDADGYFIPPDVNTDEISGFALLDFPTQTDVDEYVLYLNSFMSTLNNKLDTYVDELKTKENISYTQQNFVNGRSVLINEAHGETPYLALKGQISTIETKIGAQGGTHTVTLSGYGLEKILKDNQLYYEDMVTSGGDATLKADYNANYVNMLPPIGLLHLVSRWSSKQLLMGDPTEYTEKAYMGYFWFETALTSPADEKNEDNDSKNKPNTLFDGKVLIRGQYLLSSFTPNPTVADTRLFAPLGYFDTSRITEMIRVVTESYADSKTEAITNVAVTVDSGKSVLSNMRKLGGVAEFYELFVDETGRVRYRLSFEAWERTPQPEYTPTILDTDILADGATFSQSDSDIATTVDVLPVRGQGSVYMRDFALVGRSVPGASELPLEELSPDIPKETLSPDLFRYGFKRLVIDDIYSSETGGAQKKASVYRMLYGRPIKKASIKVRNNTSYRRGETVLVYLERTKHRSKSLVDIEKTLAWLKYMKTDKATREAYIGVDRRLLNRDAYGVTRGSYEPIPVVFPKYEEDPHMFVLDQFITTFEFLKSTLPGVNVITPDYFPPTYWFFTQKTGAFYAWDENKLDDNVIIDLYYSLLQAAVLGNSAAADAIPIFFQQFPGIINAVKFQTVRAASYYIESVSHGFQHGTEFTTSLGLNYGQDTLVLLDPKKLIPIGFLSVEKKVKTGWDDDIQNALWFSPRDTLSPIQNMYFNQRKEDTAFKSASFLHNASLLRNSANYMYDLAHREGLETGLAITVDQSPSGGRGVIGTPTTNAFPPESSGANDSRAIAYRIGSEYDNITEAQIENAAATFGKNEAAIRAYFEGLQ